MNYTATPTYKLAALGCFRWSAFFLCAVAAFSMRDEETSAILLVLIFLLDVASANVNQVVLFKAEHSYMRAWADTLANRIFYEQFYNKIRSRENIDIPHMFTSATKEAKEDIREYVANAAPSTEWGLFAKTIAGVWWFFWLWIRYGAFYGFAGIIGASIKH